jgi:hypothetical protein
MNTEPDNTDQPEWAPSDDESVAPKPDQLTWAPPPQVVSTALASIDLGDITSTALAGAVPDLTAFRAHLAGVDRVMEAIDGIKASSDAVNLLGGLHLEFERRSPVLDGIMGKLESARSPVFDFTKNLGDNVPGLWTPGSSLKPFINTGASPLAGIVGAGNALEWMQPRPEFGDSLNAFERSLAKHASGLAGVASAMESARKTMFDLHRVDEAMNRMRSRIIPPMEALHFFGDNPAGFSPFTDVMKTIDAARGPLFDVAKLASSVWAGMDHSSFMDRMLSGHTEVLVDALRGWSSWAGRGMWAARFALNMALRAKKAVERGDLDAVKEFMRDWLGFTIFPFDLVTSASLVLLDVRAWLPPGISEPNFDPSPTLRKLTLAEHRRLKRQLTENPGNPALRLNGKSLYSLDKPRKVADGLFCTLNEMRPDPGTPDPGDVWAENMITDPRVLRLWSEFTDLERAILFEKGQPGTTWPAAAVACGASPAAGDRLRRKIAYLNKTGAAEKPPSAEATG